MEIGTLLLLALGLAMDALAVSVSNGMYYGNWGRKQAAATALTFGIFQGIMPVLGYGGGRLFSRAVSSLDHWIALVVLGVIGGNMVMESLREKGAGWECKQMQKRFSPGLLLLQATATSVDALAVGVSFALMQIHIGRAAAIIGVVTLVCCLAGGALGKQFGLLLGRRARLLGGVVLIAIGLKIFLCHTLG